MTSENAVNVRLVKIFFSSILFNQYRVASTLCYIIYSTGMYSGFNRINRVDAWTDEMDAVRAEKQAKKQKEINCEIHIKTI